MTEQVPEDWQALGFSGDFCFRAQISPATPEMVAEWEARVPCRLPLGSNGNNLALRVDRTVDPPEMVIVRTDEAAICDLVVPPFRGAGLTSVRGTGG